MEDVPIPSADAGIAAPPSFRVQEEQGRLSVFFAGNWTWRLPQPPMSGFEQGLPQGVKEVCCHGEGVKHWDSSLLALLVRLRRQCDQAQIPFRTEMFPPKLMRLLENMLHIKPHKETEKKRAGLFHGAGLEVAGFWEGIYRALYFTGECAQGLAKVWRFPKALRWPECLLIMQECGPASLSIVGLIGFLTGCILAWQGALQLRQFGAEIYVADLVGVALVREMGPIMVAIVLAGRIGASFAAQLATMESSEEVDALRTWGFSPVQFLALPRLVALTCMMPLLVLYADLLGIVGGLAVSSGILGLSRSAFLAETWKALHMGDLEVGLMKSLVFAAGVAAIGCASGLAAERSADGVGVATTSSVVKSILFIIVVDAIFGACSQPIKI